MAEATSYTLSQLFSGLTGRKITVVDAASDSPLRGPNVYGIYELVPHGSSIIVKADLALLGSLGGILMGMPETTVKQALLTSPLDEMLRDAMHEVLNITSSALSAKGRAVLRKMEIEQGRGEALLSDLLERPHIRGRFQATMNGYTGGQLSVFTAF